jgi:hypothetical protein
MAPRPEEEHVLRFGDGLGEAGDFAFAAESLVHQAGQRGEIGEVGLDLGLGQVTAILRRLEREEEEDE